MVSQAKSLLLFVILVINLVIGNDYLWIIVFCDQLVCFENM